MYLRADGNFHDLSASNTAKYRSRIKWEVNEFVLHFQSNISLADAIILQVVYKPDINQSTLIHHDLISWLNTKITRHEVDRNSIFPMVPQISFW